MRTGVGLRIVSGLLFLFMLAPVLLVAWISISSSTFLSIPPDGYSLRWYQSLPEQTKLFDALLYGLYLAAGSTVISVTLGTMAALALGRHPSRRLAWLASIFILPLVVPAIVTGVAIYIYLFQLSILLDQRLAPTTGALMIAHVLVTLPWTFRLTYAGLTTLGDDLDRASLDLGRGQLYTLFFVTIPLLRPVLVAATVFAFIFSFGNLEISLFLVRPGVATLPVEMMQYAEFRIDPTIAAMSTLQIVIVGLLLLVLARFVRIGDIYGSADDR